jgi:CheY-like chemotaxis protein/anti-sigma regulatory factor (Ser/Thr protein kinase)
MAVARLFTRAGLGVPLEAVDASEALAAAAAGAPDLIVLDLAMPGRSGFDVLPDLLEVAPQAVVVILSNLPRRRLVRSLQLRGAVGYVEKSVPADRLVEEILMAAALSDLTRHHVLTLPGDLAASSTGRRFVRNLLDEDNEAIAHDVELLVSELVTNAVVHADTDPRLEVRIASDTVRVEVYDADRSMPVARQPDAEGPGGRGLHLVDRLASRWGFEQIDDGKLVWFEIDRSR